MSKPSPLSNAIFDTVYTNSSAINSSIDGQFTITDSLRLNTLKVEELWKVALAGWLSWLEHHPVHQKVAGSIPGQGTYPGCGFDPLSGSLPEADPSSSLTSMFLSLPHLPFSLSKISKHILR